MSCIAHKHEGSDEECDGRAQCPDVQALEAGTLPPGKFYWRPEQMSVEYMTAFLRANRKRFAIVKHFRFDHLRADLAAVSSWFARMACMVIAIGGERDPQECAAALRKLKEAKDCAVCAALPPAEGWS